MTGILAVISKWQTFISAGETVIRLLTALKQMENNLTGGRRKVNTLFGCLADADFTRGANYPRDDVDSLEIFKKWICVYFRRERQIKFHAQLASADINKHLCSVGGPVDHIFTRYAMGYDKQGLKQERILPYIYPLKEAGAKPEKILRKWKNEVRKERPWFIADRNGKECFRPETDRKGFLKKDFFMLIVAPNTFTDEAYERGQKHIIMAPAHGLAQLVPFLIRKLRICHSEAIAEESLYRRPDASPSAQHDTELSFRRHKKVKLKRFLMTIKFYVA